MSHLSHPDPHQVSVSVFPLFVQLSVLFTSDRGLWYFVLGHFELKFVLFNLKIERNIRVLDENRQWDLFRCLMRIRSEEGSEEQDVWSWREKKVIVGRRNKRTYKIEVLQEVHSKVYLMMTWNECCQRFIGNVQGFSNSSYFSFLVSSAMIYEKVVFKLFRGYSIESLPKNYVSCFVAKHLRFFVLSKILTKYGLKVKICHLSHDMRALEMSSK